MIPSKIDVWVLIRTFATLRPPTSSAARIRRNEGWLSGMIPHAPHSALALTANAVPWGAATPSAARVAGTPRVVASNVWAHPAVATSATARATLRRTSRNGSHPRDDRDIEVPAQAER